MPSTSGATPLMKKMVWAHAGVDNWYKNGKGRVVANSPWRLVDYWAMTEAPDPDDYIVR